MENVEKTIVNTRTVGHPDPFFKVIFEKSPNRGHDSTPELIPPAQAVFISGFSECRKLK